MIFKAPEKIQFRNVSKPSVFLAGTIDMGNSEDWQASAATFFSHIMDWNVINPRREDWDSSWPNDYLSPEMYQQINWELKAMEKADVIVMFFAKDSQSPITLAELGLHARSGKLYVVCENEFWRQANVDAICDYYNIPQFPTFTELIQYFKDNN